MRPRASDTLIIVPARNEAEAIGLVLAELRDTAPQYDVVVINDGSTDETASIARAAGCRIVEMPYNLGIGAAVQAGFKYAIELGYTYAVQMDADGQHPASELERLLDPVRSRECQMCSGSRFLNGEHYDGSSARRQGTRLLSWLCSLMSGQRITDATSGFRAFGPLALEYLSSYYPADYPEPEAIVLLSRRGIPLREVPVQMRRRQAGRSSIHGARSVYYMAKVCLSLLLAALKEGPARQAA